MGELVGEDRVDRSLVVDIVREVHVDLVGDDVVMPQITGDAVQ